MSTRFEPSSAGLAFDHVIVQRASRSFWASFFGLAFQASGTRPAFKSAFSASALRCLGAATTVASMICPPIARKPVTRNAAS